MKATNTSVKFAKETQKTKKLEEKEKIGSALFQMTSTKLSSISPWRSEDRNSEKKVSGFTKWLDLLIHFWPMFPFYTP